MERGPPDAFFYLGPGPTIGRRHGPAPGFGFDFETASDQIDSAMPQKRILGASVCFGAVAEKEWRGRDRRKFSRTRKKSPGLPAGRAEGFPVQGELCLRGTSCRLGGCGGPSEDASLSVTRCLHRLPEV